MRITFVLIPAFLVLFTPSNAQQDMPACVAEMMKQSSFMECFQGFMGFMKNIAGAEGGQPPAQGGDPNQAGQKIMKMICSSEGKAAMKCMMPFLQQCPALTQQTPGFDMSSFMGSGGLDATCDVLSGPCSKVMQCIQGATPEMAGKDVNPEAPPKSSNPFSSFFMGVAKTCGPMKAQLQCLMKYEKECGDKVRELENVVKQSIEAGLEDENSAVANYDDMKKFMTEECPNIDKIDETTKTCIMQKMNSEAFTKCYKNATMGYTVQEDDKCRMYDMQSECLKASVEECGKDSMELIQRNMNLVVKNVPASCTLQDTSAATKNVKLATSTLLMVAVSAFVLF